jgi:hypothetical protein
MYITECKVTKKIIMIYHFLKKIIQQPHKGPFFFIFLRGKGLKRRGAETRRFFLNTESAEVNGK